MLKRTAVDGLGFDREYAEDILRVFLYSLAGIAALNLVRIFMNRLILLFHGGSFQRLHSALYTLPPQICRNRK